tara:strand:+ start:8647 stop:10161 length:1515 start_codon:yes stop_codon:yes gene_type:complete
MFNSFDLIHILENSNFNGVAWGVVCILFYLSVYFLIIYFRAKEIFYLFYSIYAFVNAINILKYLKNVFFEELISNYIIFFHHLHFPLQFISYVFFSLFLLEILQFNKRHPLFYKRVYQMVYLLSFIFVLFVIGRYLFDGFYILRGFYFYFIMPLGFFITVYSFLLILKMNDTVKYYILSGMFIISIAAFTLALLTFGKGIEAINKYYSIFYISLLIENLLFTYALSIKQREAYLEKVSIQKQYLIQLRENERIKTEQNIKLENELAKKEKELNFVAKKAEEERVAKLKSEFENELQILHLASLQSQMNPHFIFNALNSIKVFLIENNKEKAVYYLNKFSKLIRKILESSRVESHSLEEELEIITLYHSIENIRFDEGIQFTIQKDPKVLISKIKVPPLLLQPFVENAIWHGLMLSEKERKIIIKVYEENSIVKLSLIDNGIGREKSMELKNKKSYKKESVGLKMTSERLSFFNKKQNLNYSFKFIDRKDNEGNTAGTEVCFTFA